MMTIRKSTPADRLQIVRLLRDAHAAALDMPVPFNAAYAHALAARHDEDGMLLSILYAPEGRTLGVLLAGARPHPFGPVLYATETAWWIAPEARGRAANTMLDAYEAWAAEKGCAFCHMAALVSFPRAELVYLRRGYKPLETHFVKHLVS